MVSKKDYLSGMKYDDNTSNMTFLSNMLHKCMSKRIF